MYIDKQQVRGIAEKIKVIGDDAEGYLQRVSGAMEGSLQGNEGFHTVSTLREVLNRLSEQTKQVANTSRTLGQNVTIAANNHEVNDIVHGERFNSLSEVLGNG